MSDFSVSVFLFICLIAAPTSAFLVSPLLLPIFVVFPISGFMSGGKVGYSKLAILTLAPVFGIILGTVTGNPLMQMNALRWLVALTVGIVFASELGMSNAAYILHRVSGRIRYGRKFLESLAFLISLAGPFSKQIRGQLRKRKKEKMNLLDAVQEVLSGIENLNPELTGVPSAHRSKVRLLILSCFAWGLFLSGIAGIP